MKVTACLTVSMMPVMLKNGSSFIRSRRIIIGLAWPGDEVVGFGRDVSRRRSSFDALLDVGQAQALHGGVASSSRTLRFLGVEFDAFQGFGRILEDVAGVCGGVLEGVGKFGDAEAVLLRPSAEACRGPRRSFLVLSFRKFHVFEGFDRRLQAVDVSRADEDTLEELDGVTDLLFRHGQLRSCPRSRRASQSGMPPSPTMNARPSIGYRISDDASFFGASTLAA
jgi:hypothetical protein